MFSTIPGTVEASKVNFVGCQVRRGWHVDFQLMMEKLTVFAYEPGSVQLYEISEFWNDENDMNLELVLKRVSRTEEGKRRLKEAFSHLLDDLIAKDPDSIEFGEGHKDLIVYLIAEIANIEVDFGSGFAFVTVTLDGGHQLRASFSETSVKPWLICGDEYK